jgi:hypothetical protein
MIERDNGFIITIIKLFIIVSKQKVEETRGKYCC